MNNNENASVFDRSGLAALSDIQTEECQNIFSVLEGQQSEFISQVSEFRSEEYKWPHDPLHCWSRIWEYPYVYYHITKYVKGLAEGSRPVVADVGSGVTFFPFSIAQLGCDVICTDIDPICEKDILRVRQNVSYSSAKVDFRLINNNRLPFVDDECDAVYCISVLEHIPDFENTVKEIERILKPGGLFLVTCDLDLDPAGNKQLNIDQFERLTSVIGQQFRMLCTERTIHPLDILTTRNSPFSDESNSIAKTISKLIKQKTIKLLLGRKAGYSNIIGPAPLAILGLVLQKRQ